MNAQLPGHYLSVSLAPLAQFLTRCDVTDLYINRPQEVWIETLGGAIARHDVLDLTVPVLERMARQVAAWSNQGISRAHPLLAASLPDGARIQVVMPPATRGSIAIAIRKHVSAGLSLDDYQSQGAFADSETEPADDLAVASVGSVGPSNDLREAVVARRNILVSGGTSSGKTTFLNALLREVPLAERIITIEDTAEIDLAHPNSVGLIAARNDLREASVTTEDLLNAALRMRPDRVCVGELRGGEAYTFLRTINSGHPGSMSTIHADSPEGAINQLALLILQTGARLSWDNIVRYVHSTVDLIIQLERRDGRRRVSKIWKRESSL